MLVLFIISTVVGLLASIFFKTRRFTSHFICSLIAVLTTVAFCSRMIAKLTSNEIDVNFWSVFAILSLIAWQFAFLFDNGKNIINYEFSFVLLAWTISIFYSSIFNPNCLKICKEDHTTTEVVYIITTIDDSCESAYGDGFIINKVYNSKYNSYQYYYKLEDGKTEKGSIPANSTIIKNIDVGESPYLEIIITRDCSGYNSETKSHALGFSKKSYILHIPENSILTTYQG